jgi:hypothetical protein
VADTTATLAAFNLRPIDWSNIGATEPRDRAAGHQVPPPLRRLGVKFAAARQRDG